MTDARICPTSENENQKPSACRLDDLAEFRKGWRAARCCEFKSDGATLDALNGSPSALGAFFAAQHTEGGGAKRRKASATISELNAVATRALSVLGFHNQHFEDVISEALRFANAEWAATEVLSRMKRSAKKYHMEVVLKLIKSIERCWENKELAAHQAISRNIILLLCNVEDQCPKWDSKLIGNFLRTQMEHEIISVASTAGRSSSKRLSI